MGEISTGPGGCAAMGSSPTRSGAGGTRRDGRGAPVSRPSLPDFSRARVLVAGDVMLDRYWFGDVSRISPEAPVPVVHVQRTEERPGGAANVARNITALDGGATLLAVVGADEAGDSLERLLRVEKVSASLHRDASLPTTV